MGLFTKKPKVSVQAWCEDFYGNHVFAAPIGGVDPWQVICESVRKQVAQSDPTFLNVDTKDLSDELLALRLEVIGVVWSIRFKLELLPKQSECTRLYLLNHNQERVWRMMEPYNQAVAKAVIEGPDVTEFLISYVNSKRSQAFEKWAPTVSDPKDAARAANRLGSGVPWESHQTHSYLANVLTTQLHCEVNGEARLKLLAYIDGFFRGASEALGETRIVT